MIEGKISRILINIDFKMNYTFIFIARKVDAKDAGSIFTSVSPNRFFGWINEGKIFKVGSSSTTVGTYNKDTDLHCYIVICTNGQIQFWDLDYKLPNTSILKIMVKLLLVKHSKV